MNTNIPKIYETCKGNISKSMPVIEPVLIHSSRKSGQNNNKEKCQDGNRKHTHASNKQSATQETINITRSQIVSKRLQRLCYY